MNRTAWVLPNSTRRIRNFVGLCVAAAVLTTSGCGRPPTRSISPEEKNAPPKGDPWDGAAKRLRKEVELVSCKAALTGLNHDLATTDKVDKPAAPTKEALDALAAIVPLSAEDRKEIDSATFTAHDPVYLAECLYLRDAARSLSLPGMPPEQLAKHGFAWVCRQVYLNPWLMRMADDKIVAAALPPAYVLRRGHGSALERMYVFLALLQQLGLDGCLIGPPDAGEVSSSDARGADRNPLPGGPPRPFWAVGVRIDKDVHLFDPWRGEPFPATLKALAANPDAHAAWFESKANAAGTTAETVKKAAVYLAAHANSLAPRMATLEKHVAAEVGVKLATNPAAVRDAFADPKPRYWNPPGDRFAYGRAARTFLPFDEGGSDRTEASADRMYETYFRLQLPPPEQAIPAELLRNPSVAGEIKNRIGGTAYGVYEFAYLKPPPTPRERVQRGQFQDAARMLVERQDEFERSLLRVRNTPDAEKTMSAWVAKTTELYDSLGRDPTAKASLDEHWRSPSAALVFDRSIGEVGQAEAAFLLALCKHEQAERAQARFDRAAPEEAAKLKPATLDAWVVAAGAWNGYREQYAAAQAAMPGRADHVRALSTRARANSSQK